MTREERVDWLCRLRSYVVVCQSGFNPEHVPKYIEALSEEIEALQTAHCEDCISRQAAIDALDKGAWGVEWDKALAKAMLENLPSAQPKPKTGRWEYVQYDGNPKIGNWHCSECNRIVCGAISARNPVYAYKYCPECGAKMESEDKE